MKKSNVFLSATIAIFLGACASEPPIKPVAQKETKQVHPTPVVTPVVQKSTVIKKIEPVKIIEQPPVRREVRFDYDSSTLNAQAQDLVTQHAKYLIKHPEQKIVIEGHADERGGDDYNFALGERRASAIRQALIVKGVVAEQLQTKSYGEKQPKLIGQGEEVWQQNRRAALDYIDNQQAVTQSNNAKLNGSPMVVSDN